MQQAMNALMQGRERERGADVVAVQIFFFFWTLVPSLLPLQLKLLWKLVRINDIETFKHDLVLPR